MVKEEVGTIVNTIEGLDSEIASLQQKRNKITSDNYEELLKHDVETLKSIETILGNLITGTALEVIEDYDVLGSVEEAISDIENKIKKN